MIKKTIKIIFLSIVVVTISLGLIITLLVTTVSQDTIKNKAIQLVHKHSGRELKITGNISWTLFPWLGIKIQNITLGNPPDFKDSHFATAKEISISVKLIPLIFKHSIEADHLILNDLDLQLVINTMGRNNWQDLLTFASHSKQPTTTTTNTDKFAVNNITIDNGNISWQDQKNDRKLKISKLNLSCKNVNLKHPFSLKTSFNLAHLSPFLDGNIDIKTQISLVTPNSYQLKNLKLQTTNAIISGALQLPDLTGNLIISDTGSQALPYLLGIIPQKQPNSSFKVIVELSPTIIKIPSIKANLDEMALTGNVNYSANTLTFDVFLNKLDTTIFNEPNSQVKTVASSQSSPSIWQTIKIDGNLKIGAIQAEKLHLNNFTTKIIGNNGLFNCKNLEFDFYGGKVSGNVTTNIQNSIPQSNLQLSLVNASMHALLVDLIKYDKLSGNLVLNTKINIRGLTANEVLHSLNGDGNILITNGSYHGVDIPYEIRRTHALLNAKPLPQKSGSSSTTNFDRLTTSFNIHDTILNTTDFLLQAHDYQVNGKGSANLITNYLDIVLSAYSTHDKNFFLPVKITGPINNPSVTIDAAVVLEHVMKKSVVNVIQRQVEKNLPQDLKKILPLDNLFH
ncbi:MAG: AsmA family protein [Coxiellaceae bacterium]|jgi:AsmA protein|nr:AsmA family protein [Coxiellaceae bacterium]